MAKKVKLGVELDLDIKTQKAKKSIDKIDKDLSKEREMSVKVDVDTKELEKAKKEVEDLSNSNKKLNLDVDLSDVNKSKKGLKEVDGHIDKIGKSMKKVKSSRENLVESLAFGKDKGFSAEELKGGLRDESIMKEVQNLRLGVVEKNKILEEITKGFAKDIQGSEKDASFDFKNLQGAVGSLNQAFRSLRTGDILGFVSSVKEGVSAAKTSIQGLNRTIGSVDLSRIGKGKKAPSTGVDLPDIDLSTSSMQTGLNSVTGSAGSASKAVSGFGKAAAGAASSSASAGVASASMSSGVAAVGGTASTAASGVTAMGGAIAASGGTILIVVAAVVALVAVIGALVVKFKLMLLNLRLARDGLSSLGKFALGAVSAFYNLGGSVDYLINKLASMGGLAGWVGKAFQDIQSKVDSAFSIDSIKAFSDECTDLFSNLVELQNVIDNVFPDLSGEVNSFAKGAKSLYGLTELQAKQGASKFGGLLQSAALDEEVKVKASLDLTSLAADLSSFYNLEYDEAVTKLASGLVGETEPLRQVGINMTVAEVESWAQSVGKLSQSWANLTSSEQYILRYDYLMSHLGVVMGDFSNTQFTWANQFRLMGAGLEDIKTKLGYILMQIMYPILVVANQIVTLISSLLGGFMSSLGFDDFMMGGGGGALAPAVDTSGVDSLGDSYDNAADKAEKAKKASQDLAGVFKLNNLSEDNSNSGSSGGSGGGFGGAGGVGGLGNFDKPSMELPQWLKDVVDYFKELEDIIESGDWGLVGEKLGEGLNAVFDWLVLDEKAFTAVKSALDKFIKTVNGFLKTVDLAKLGTAVSSWVNIIVDSVNQLAEGIDWSTLGTRIGEGLNGLISGINWGNLGKAWVNSFNALFTTLKEAVYAFDWVGLGKSLGEFINGIFENPEGFLNAAKFAAELINGLFTTLQHTIKTADWKQVGKTLKETLTTFFGTIDWTTVFTTLVDMAIGMIDALIAFFGDDGEWKEVTDKIKEGIKAAVEKAKEEDLSGKVVELVKTLFGENGFGDAIQDLMNLIPWGDILSTLAPAAMEVAKGLSVNFLESLVTGLFDGNIFSYLLAHLLTMFTPALNMAVQGIFGGGLIKNALGLGKEPEESTSKPSAVNENGNIKSFEELQAMEDNGDFEPLKAEDLIDEAGIKLAMDNTTTGWEAMMQGFDTLNAEYSPKIGSAVSSLGSSISGVWGKTTSWCTTTWDNFWLGTTTETNDGTGEVETRTGGFSSVLKSTWETMTGYLSGVWGKLWSGENSIKNTVVKGAQKAYDAVTGWFGTLKEEFNTKKEELFKKWSDLWTDIKEYPGKKAEEIKQAVADAFEVAKGAITDWVKAREEDWTKFWEGLPGKIGNIGETIKKKVDSVLSTNIFSGLGSKLSGELNSATIDSKSINASVNYSLGSQPSYSPNIPKLARGGVIQPNSEFLAVLGDQKSGVNVETPLSTMIDAFNSALQGSGFGAEGDTNIEVYINDERQDNSAVTVRKQTFRSNGRN